jgi:VIT1/CCC1 family predicted Fe2+/Mn2+ transporter
LHRIAIEEKEEIESNRPQEKEELIALYGAKGFSGPLLDKVVEVLMADQDRLLRVMLQEEMGFRIEEHPHPLIQGLMASLGVLFSMIVLIPLVFGLSVEVVLFSSALFVGVVGGVVALLEKNDVIPAIVWNGTLAAVTLVLIHACMEIFA